MRTATSSGEVVDRGRWKLAQRYEASYWEGIAHQIEEDERVQLGFYEWRADRLRERLNALGLERLTDGSARVLEVGSGPVGLAVYFPGRRRVSIDPLADFYAENPVLVDLRDPSVRYDQGVGEELPYGDGAFDLLIMENCIDHVRDVDAVMTEIARVLDREGVLYLTVNCRTRWGYGVHRLLARLGIDAGHPHTFTTGRVRRLVERHGFRLLQLESRGFLDAWWRYLRSGDLPDQLQALLGVNHFTVSLVARRASERER